MEGLKFASIAALILIASCKPPATDEMSGGEAVVASGPSEPIDSPDTTGAIWARGGNPDNLLYGKPGERPLVALTCDEGGKKIGVRRFVVADAEAKALMALIGNGHIARLPVDAIWNGRVWLWKGEYDSDSSELAVFGGRREIELTIPGAGSTVLNPSEKPGDFIAECRDPIEPRQE